MRDLDAGLPVTDDTIWRIYSMTKPITSVAAHDALRAGRAGADRPGGALHPVLRRRPRLQCRAGAEPRRRSRPPSPSASGTCSPTPPGSPTASTTRTRSTRCTACSGFDFSSSTRRGPRRRVRPARRAPAAVPAGHRVELRRLDGRARPGRRGRLGAAVRRVLRRARPRPAGHGRDRVVGRRGGPRPAGHALHARAGRRPRGEHGPRRGGDPAAAAARRRGRAGVDGGRLPPLHPDAAARR